MRLLLWSLFLVIFVSACGKEEPPPVSAIYGVWSSSPHVLTVGEGGAFQIKSNASGNVIAAGPYAFDGRTLTITDTRDVELGSPSASYLIIFGDDFRSMKSIPVNGGETISYVKQ